MEEIDVAVFAFDDEARLRLVNRAGERLLAQPAERLLGRDATELGLAECLDGRDAAHARDDLPRRRRPLGRAAQRLPRGAGSPTSCWCISDVRRPCARRSGRPGSASSACSATSSTTRWRRSSRSPATLATPARPRGRAAGLARRTCSGGLSVIARPRGGADPLHGRLRAARPAAPAAARRRSSRGRWCGASRRWRRASTSRSRPAPEVVVHADADQLEQLLINLVRNAADAALETGGGVAHRLAPCRAASSRCSSRTSGPGLGNTDEPLRPLLHHQARRLAASASCSAARSPRPTAAA